MSAVVLLALSCLTASVRAVDDVSTWTQLGADSGRDSTSQAGTLDLAEPSWVAWQDTLGRPIDFVGQSSPVVTLDAVLAIGLLENGEAYLFSFDRRSGFINWQSPIEAPEQSSYSSPAVDARNRRVLVASGYSLCAIDLTTGVLLWTVTFANPIVNASPVVTQDLWPSDRVFITDADGFGTTGTLHCINVSSRLGAANPYDPGEVVWSLEIGGATGNTPAYADGRVYVSGVGDYFSTPPQPAPIICVDARSRVMPAPLWIYTNTPDASARFFSGLTVKGGFVYAASYDFVGVSGQPTNPNNSNLVKIRASNGSLIWSTPCNRTSSIPVVLPPRPGSAFSRVVLSAGLTGFSGTFPNLQLFEDRGASVAQIWDSALATWIDLDGDRRIDTGEYLSIGGWTIQPAVSTGLGPLTAFIGSLPTGGDAVNFPACNRISAINLDMLPAQAGFVRVSSLGCGSSPALADENVYSIGGAGIYAFGPAPFRYDVDQDGAVTIEDLYAWEQGRGLRDVDLNGVVLGNDRDLLTKRLRRMEY
jgi:outer membrane protein assembly factor BamB